MSGEGEELVRAIAERFSGVRPLLEEHLKDNDEILPHVFFGDLTRHIMSLFAESNGDKGAAARAELTGILDLLERTYAANRGDHQELISVSFLENLPYPQEEHSEIQALLGPNLSKQLKAIVEWRPGNNDHKN